MPFRFFRDCLTGTRGFVAFVGGYCAAVSLALAIAGTTEAWADVSDSLKVAHETAQHSDRVLLVWIVGACLVTLTTAVAMMFWVLIGEVRARAKLEERSAIALEKVSRAIDEFKEVSMICKIRGGGK